MGNKTDLPLMQKKTHVSLTIFTDLLDTLNEKLDGIDELETDIERYQTISDIKRRADRVIHVLENKLGYDRFKNKEKYIRTLESYGQLSRNLDRKLGNTVEFTDY